jgi:hypothetical protein
MSNKNTGNPNFLKELEILFQQLGVADKQYFSGGYGFDLESSKLFIDFFQKNLVDIKVVWFNVSHDPKEKFARNFDLVCDKLLEKMSVNEITGKYGVGKQFAYDQVRKTVQKIARNLFSTFKYSQENPGYIIPIENHDKNLYRKWCEENLTVKAKNLLYNQEDVETIDDLIGAFYTQSLIKVLGIKTSQEIISKLQMDMDLDECILVSFCENHEITNSNDKKLILMAIKYVIDLNID